MFTVDELCDLSYALENLIQDKRDYCADDDETPETVARLEDLKRKVDTATQGAHHG